MTDTDRNSLKIQRGQFPLWVLLFVLPTASGLVCLVQLTWQAQTREHTRLLELAALARAEAVIAEDHRDRLLVLDGVVERELTEWRTPERVLKMIRTERPDVPDSPTERYRDYYLLHGMGNHSIHFFIQASDDDLRYVVRELTNGYPSASPMVQSRSSDFIHNLRYYIPRRMDVVQEEVERFLQAKEEDFVSRVKTIAPAESLEEGTLNRANGGSR